MQWVRPGAAASRPRVIHLRDVLAGFARLAPLPAIVEPMQPLTGKDQVVEKLLGASRALFRTTWPVGRTIAAPHARAGRP